MKIQINNIQYNLIKNYRDAFNKASVENLLTDYFYDYDYIFGDWAYGKLRLKGFYNSDNRKANKINDIKYVEDYLKSKCAYDCRHFILEKEKGN